MKKIFLFVAVAALTISLNSCSSGSSGGGDGYISFKINGVEKSFKAGATETGGTVWVHGYIGSVDAPTEIIDFYIQSGETGDVMDSPTYTNASEETYYGDSGTSDVTVNNGSTVKGTFSGIMAPFNSSNSSLTITSGEFSASISPGN
jgi:hypothetical protein